MTLGETFGYAVEVNTIDPDTRYPTQRVCHKEYVTPKSTQEFEMFCIMTVNPNATINAQLNGGRCSEDYITSFNPTLKMNIIEMTPPQ